MCIFYHGFKNLKAIFFSVLLHCLHISGYLGQRYRKNVGIVLKKPACLFGQVKNKMYLPFFQNSLAGASGLVLMSVPVVQDSRLCSVAMTIVKAG